MNISAHDISQKLITTKACLITLWNTKHPYKSVHTTYALAREALIHSWSCHRVSYPPYPSPLNPTPYISENHVRSLVNVTIQHTHPISLILLPPCHPVLRPRLHISEERLSLQRVHAQSMCQNHRTSLSSRNRLTRYST